MKISYAITVKDELEEIQCLIPFLLEHKKEQDEIVILWDSKGDQNVWDYIYSNKSGNFLISFGEFEQDFSEWKNKLNSLCSGDFIFNIDADEIPHPDLIKILPALLEHNPTVEVYLVPRINTVEGLTQEHIQKWGWNVKEYFGTQTINFPDYQFRIYKNLPHIFWKNKVHEILTGYKNYSFFPEMEEYCLAHHKTIERQERQNTFYQTL